MLTRLFVCFLLQVFFSFWLVVKFRVSAVTFHSQSKVATFCRADFSLVMAIFLLQFSVAVVMCMLRMNSMGCFFPLNAS